MVEERDLISILMPTYNVEEYISEAIESLLNQTYSNIEIIVVDDGSTDGTYSILKTYADRDSRIKLLRNLRNLNIVGSLNRALKYARGDYIARMDGDDVSVSTRIEELHNYLVCNPDCDIVGSFSEAINAKGETIAKRSFPCSDRLIKKTLRYCSTIQHIWMAKSSAYQTLRGYREFPGAEDYDFLLRAKQAGLGLSNYPKSLYKVRLREGNTESTKGLERIKTKEFVYKYSLEKHPVDELTIDEKRLSCYLTCSDSALRSYRDASNLLNRAKHERGNKALLVKDTLHAALLSRYMQKYLFEVIRVRIAVMFEKLARGRDRR